MTEKVWTAAEVELLRTHFQQDGVRSIAERLHRTTDAVRSLAHRLGLRAGDRTRPRLRPVGSGSELIGSSAGNHPEVTETLKTIRRWGTIRLRPRHRLRLSVPVEHQAELLAVRSMLKSHHAVRFRARRVVTEICGRGFVEDLLRLGLPVR